MYANTKDIPACLQLTAKAMGIKYVLSKDGTQMWTERPWFPLSDDRDAYEIVNKFGLTVESNCFDHGVSYARVSKVIPLGIGGLEMCPPVNVRHDDVSPDQAVRQAIVLFGANLNTWDSHKDEK